MRFKTSDSKLEVYAEGRTRKMLVGILEWNREASQFEFTYEKSYLLAPKAIPLGPELPISKRHHINKGKLFPSLLDRIPSKNNPAYADYCEAAGISAKEKNPIILLGTIGRRGPSAFVLEPVVTDTYDGRSLLIKFRQQHKISLHEIGLALALNKVTLQRIEAKKSSDMATLRLLTIFFSVPEALNDQLMVTGKLVHRHTASALLSFVKSNREGNS